MSLNLSPVPAFPLHGDIEEAAPVQQEGADLAQQAAPFLQGGAGHHQNSDQAPLPHVQPTPVRQEQLRLAARQGALLAGRVADWEREQATPAPAVRDVRDVAGVGVDQVSLADWLYPEVPIAYPGPVIKDALGWNMIDKWDVWDCALCEFTTMQDVPRAYREVWSTAVAIVLRAVQAVDEGIEMERALKWFLILPKAVFRQARQGGKADRGQITRRINCLVRRDWGGLLSLLERDCLLPKGR